eukprot:TRINITY_DN314_c0_g4_i1.p1 TRINITY_DN314_c0_g4~~TRINITY_DN314_c0_g4_i1.p1  ORF type:complete len:252 (+),score=65.30 TRINITY_DN314_c0_g4_i1:111-866(+)
MICPEVITEEECKVILSVLHRVRTGELEAGYVTYGTSGSHRRTNMDMRQGVKGYWGVSDFGLAHLKTPDVDEVIQSVRERLRAATGVVWDYKQQDLMLPTNYYTEGEFVHPHRDVNVAGWGPVHSVASVIITDGFTGGDLFLNDDMELNAPGSAMQAVALSGGELEERVSKHRSFAVKEHIPRRRHFAVPARGACVFDNNDGVLHGTEPVASGERVVCTFRSGHTIRGLAQRQLQREGEPPPPPDRVYTYS